ncbi:ATPase, T2SS/T4P/T4SS family [Bacillus sp. 1P06AnD]|uniref:ATPase, T2SS/T4P/T4SS family n=1 Tax=Bacillus sp. 1P06AnD TaxID=3132208 RepID=UPI0039A18650
MRNLINYELLPPMKNEINIERLLFFKQQTSKKGGNLKYASNKISAEITKKVKDYLANEEYRKIIMDSFGNRVKQESLKNIIHSFISSKDFLAKYGPQLSEFELVDLTEFWVEKIAGIDVLQQLAEIESVTDIKCLDWNNIWVDDIEKGMYKTDVTFESEEDYVELCIRFAQASSKSFSHAEPSVDAIFPYMRVNFVGQDLSPKISLSIRLISKELRLSDEYIQESGYATPLMMNLLKYTFATESHLISGATGTGKTELLRYATKDTKNRKNIIMIEDTPETYLDEIYPEKPINMWRNRQANNENQKDFGYTYHIRNAMRQNPFYIFIQESRGAESAEILKANETGHVVNTTLHAFSGIDAVYRMIDLCQEAQHHPDSYYGKRITRSFSIGLHIKRYKNKRVLNEIVEYIGYEEGEVKANVLFEYDSVAKRHIKKGTLSEALWKRLLEEHEDLEELEDLSPYKVSMVR